MKTYQNFEEIEYDLKRLKLEKNIAMEELKIVKRDVEDFLSPMNWITALLTKASKYGVLLLFKKIFK